MRPLTVFTVTPINPRPPLREGDVLPVFLEHTIHDHNDYDSKGPHRSGKAEILADGRLRISIIDTAAGRHAIGVLNDHLVDVVLWEGTVRLR